VLLISSKSLVLFNRISIPKFRDADDKNAILEALGKPGKAVELSGVEARRVLLKAVRGSDVAGDARRGLRYLLHGAPQGFMMDEARLWIDPGSGDSPWIKLWRK
jgi:hypothetical protein